jgi:hypothetical protein
MEGKKGILRIYTEEGQQTYGYLDGSLMSDAYFYPDGKDFAFDNKGINPSFYDLDVY